MGEDGNHEGFIVDLLDALELDYRIVPPADGKYGSKNELNGEWTGMMGMIQKNVSSNLFTCILCKM